MGILATQVGVFLNNLRNPNVTIGILQRTVSNLYNDLLTNQIFIPKMTESFEELLNENNVIPLKLLKRTLITQSIVDGLDSTQNKRRSIINIMPLADGLINDTDRLHVAGFYRRGISISGRTIATGFSEHKIYNIMHSDPIYLLDSLYGYYLDYYYHLKKVQSSCYDSLYSLKELQILFDIYDLYQINAFNKWNTSQTVFQNIYERENFIDTSNYNSIVLLMMSFFIYENFIRSTDYASQLKNYMDNNIDDADSLKYTNFQTSFLSYITTNRTIISNKLNQYLLDNVFSITANNEEFETTIGDEVFDCLGPIIDSFNTTFSQSFVESFSGESFINLTMYYLFNYCSLESINSEFYPNRIAYWNIDSRLDIIETEFLTDLKEKLTNNIHNLKNIEYVGLQFKDDPIYLINAYIHSHAKWVDDMLQENMFILPTLTSMPNFGIYPINGGSHLWKQSQVHNDVFYLTFDGSIDNVLEPKYICESETILFKKLSTEDLVVGSWSYANFDNLRNDTVYIRLGASAINPNSCCDGYLTASSVTTLQELLYLMNLSNPSGIVNYIETYDFSQALIDSKAPTLACILTFQKMIGIFLDSDDFKSYIMDYLLYEVYEKIKEKISIQFDIAMAVDKTIAFFKMIFVKDLFENNLFNDLIIGYIQDCQEVCNNHMSITLTSNIVENVASNEHEFISSYTNVFNSVYLSGITAEYLTNLLDKYRI